MFTKEELEKKGLSELVQLFRGAKDDLERVKEEQATAQEFYDMLRFDVLPKKMEEADMTATTITTEDGEKLKVRVQDELYASVLAERRDAAYSWLEENGYGDLIKPTVNSSTLKAFAKEQLKDGAGLPDELFNILVRPCVRFY